MAAITGRTSDEAIRINPNVVVGYFDQELVEFNNKQSRIDWLRSRTDVGEDRLKQALIKSGVAYENFGQAVDTLSGGEKARLSFLVLNLTEPNLLILDEPTNHIDIDSREELETQVIESGAATIVTSHDRHFLEVVCNKYWVISQGRLTELDYLEHYYEQLTSIEPELLTTVSEPLTADVNVSDESAATLKHSVG